MIKNSSLIYKLFNTSCIDRVVNIVSKYSVKLSLEVVYKFQIQMDFAATVKFLHPLLNIIGITSFT